MRFLNKRDTRFVAPTLSRSDPAPGGNRDTIPEIRDTNCGLRPPASRFTSTASRKKRGPPVFLLPFPLLQTIMALQRL